jgi:hypothetical protein
MELIFFFIKFDIVFIFLANFPETCCAHYIFQKHIVCTKFDIYIFIIIMWSGFILMLLER